MGEVFQGAGEGLPEAGEAFAVTPEVSAVAG